MTTQPKAFASCPECRGLGRTRVQGVVTAVVCPKCDGLGYISSKFYRKLLKVQRMAHVALRGAR